MSAGRIILLPKATKGQFDLICSFCRRPQLQVPRLLVNNQGVGAMTTICTDCLAEATKIAKEQK